MQWRKGVFGWMTKEDTMYLEELIGGKDDVLAAAMKNPGLVPKRKPTIEQALKAVVGEVEYRAKASVIKDVLPKLQDVYDMYTITNGEFSDITDDNEVELARLQDEYGTGLDDEIEKVFEPYVQYLSADWLGRNTIDTRLWEENAVLKLAESAGKEVFKQLSYNKSPAQTLSNAGIVQSDVEIYFDQHMNQTQEQTKAMADENANELGALAERVKLHLGDDFDINEVFGDIELACDDDEILAAGALARLGLDENDWQTVQFATIEHGDDTAQVFYDLIVAAPSAKAKANAGKAAAKAAPKPAAAPAAGGIDPRVLSLLKDHSAVKDTDIAARLGVARATYLNYISGKTAFAPDEDQHATLRQQIVTDVNGLLEALSILDGADRMEVA